MTGGETVCIGIAVHAEPRRLHDTIESVRLNTAALIQLVLLPDGPDAETAEALTTMRDFLQLATAEPRGGAECFNRLAQASDGSVIVLLESGAIVGPRWLDHLLAALKADRRNGIAGPSTNRAWNEQCAFPRVPASLDDVARTAADAEHRFGDTVRMLEPLHSLADFCYVVRREVIDAIGLADESYGLGPCWEMDYNIRAARAGWRGVWACASYVYRAPFTERRRREEARLFEASKRRYQDKFCGARLRGEKSDYRVHCRGDACPNFAPPGLVRIKEPAPCMPGPAAEIVPTIAQSEPSACELGEITAVNERAPLVTCIMPTCDRPLFVPAAIRYFLRQDYPNLELVIVDDGMAAVAPLLLADSRIRLLRLDQKSNVGTKRNIACAAARGEIIVHWDDDDWYPPDRVRRQASVLNSEGFEICGTSTLYYHDAASAQAWRYHYQNSGRPWVAGNTLAYRKSWWTAHPFPEIQVGEDTRFVWAAPGSTVVDLGTPDLCVARIHERNTSRKFTASSCWRTCSMAELEAVVGGEWQAFVAASSAAALSRGFPLVSCIMPTYNRRPFVALALRAFASQVYPSKELVVVDDGTDPVGDLVAQVAGARYLRLPVRESIGEKRNRACAEALGAIIAHWDDDDWYGTDRLSRQIAPLLAGDADLTGLENSCVLELPAGRFWRTLPYLHRQMFVGDVHGGTLVYWKQLGDEGLRYPPSNIAEDAAFIRAAVRRGKRLVRVPNDGAFVYIRHGGNAWRFEAGRFLDPNGWESISPPPAFCATDIAAFQQAAAHACCTSAATSECHAKSEVYK